eukprot:2348549-Rhodomonas_salina.1
MVVMAVQAEDDCINSLDAASIHIETGRQGQLVCWEHLKEWKELGGASRRHVARCLVGKWKGGSNDLGDTGMVLNHI